MIDNNFYYFKFSELIAKDNIWRKQNKNVKIKNIFPKIQLLYMNFISVIMLLCCITNIKKNEFLISDTNVEIYYKTKLPLMKNYERIYIIIISKKKSLLKLMYLKKEF